MGMHMCGQTEIIYHFIFILAWDSKLALRCIAVLCFTLLYIALHCFTLLYIALHCITLHCNVDWYWGEIEVAAASAMVLSSDIVL